MATRSRLKEKGVSGFVVMAWRARCDPAESLNQTRSFAPGLCPWAVSMETWDGRRTYAVRVTEGLNWTAFPEIQVLPEPVQLSILVWIVPRL